MFERLAAKGPGLILGLVAALLPASSALAQRPARLTAGAAQPARAAAPAGAARSTAGAATTTEGPRGGSIIQKQRPTLKPGARGTLPMPQPKAVPKPPPSPAAHTPAWLDRQISRTSSVISRPAAIKTMIRPGSADGSAQIHGGGPFDLNLDGNAATDIEPSFLPESYSYIFSSDRFGVDVYPSGEEEPQFLAGPDYHLYLAPSVDPSVPRVRIPFALGGNDRQEEFEPNVSRDNKLVYSAFLPADSDVYDADVPDDAACTDEEGNPVTLDANGMPVRVIRISNNAITAALDGNTAATVDTTLPLQAYSCTLIPNPDDPEGDPTYAPLLIPDASPVWYPERVGRYVYFVTLRGYKADDPATHYTSLWVWDTASPLSDPTPFGSGNPHKVFSLDGQSILQPEFSPDGRFLAFTATDYAFEPDPETGVIEDPVWGFDVTKDSLAKPFKARVWVVPSAGNNLQFGQMVQATAFTDVDGNESRDIMPFWNSLNQLGFSSDRVDSDDDGLADTMNTDPATAKFDIYTMPFPFELGCFGEVLPDNTARRQTLGAAPDDDSNELNGTAAPPDPDAAALAYLQPFIVYQADDAGNWDIWATDKSIAFQLNGNILVGLPVVTGNSGLDADTQKGLRQTHRIGLPGDFVNIQVRVNNAYLTSDDEGNPNTQVFAVVKDPDPDPSFFQVIRDPNVNNNIPVDVYREVNDRIVRFCQGDFDNWTTLFGSDPTGPRIGGVIPLDPVEGQPGVFAAKWYTPLDTSDFLIDIAVVNNNGGYITDNVGGFSTAPFVPVSRVLVVSDFAGGQKAIPYTTHTLLPVNNPVESYFTWRPRDTRTNEDTQRPIVSSLGPYNSGTNSPWAVIGPRLQWQEPPAIGPNTDPGNPRILVGPGGDVSANDSLAVRSPFGNQYDLWRVQCREPITVDDVKDNSGVVTQYGVLKNYLPYLIQQPGYPIQSRARTQRVADRAVIWFSPYTGLLNGNGGQNSTAGNGGIENKGFGTIANVATQSEILKFMTPRAATATEPARQAGRIAVSGATIASTLSQDGAVTNPLLTAFNVRFESKQDQNVTNGGESARDQLSNSINGALGGENPIPYSTWDYLNLVHTGEPAPTDIQLAPYLAWVPFFEGSLFYHPRWPLVPQIESWQDGAWNQLYIGSVQAIGQGQPIWNYGDQEPTGEEVMNTLVAAVQTKKPMGAENTSPGKSLFFSFGIEGVNRYYYTGANNVVHSPNRPAAIVHNIVDFLSTGAFTGQVFVNNNVANTDNVLVYAVDVYSQEGQGRIRGTALTDRNGLYYMEGMDTGVYQLFAYKTGAVAVQNDVIQPIDTGYNTLTGVDGLTPVNLYLVTAQPGTLRGQVTDKDTGAPLAGVVVTINDIQNTVSQQTTTDANGNYVFTNVPAGLYVISIASQRVGEIDYEEFSTINNPVNVGTDNAPGDPNVGDTIYNIKIGKRAVEPKPATITVTVYDASTGESVPAPGALVTVTDLATNRPAVTRDGGPNPATTDENGQAVFDVIAGRFTITAHYEKMVGETRKVFKDQTVTLTVQPDETNPGGTAVEFTFGGILHTFAPDKILMASAPYEYNASSGNTFATVLGISDVQALANSIVAYNAEKQDFVFFPNYPADTFHLGRGYGFKLPQEGRVMEEGTAAPATSQSYPVRAEIGWNLIATPYNAPTPWTKAGGSNTVKFALRDDPTQALHDVDDTSDPVTLSNILGVLWGPTNAVTGEYTNSYTAGVSVMQPWQSYWIKVAQPTVFYFPRPVATARNAAALSMAARSTATLVAEPSLLMPRADIWGVNITASSGDYADRGLALGIGRAATNGRDLGLDMEKPAPMSGSGPTLYTAFPRPNGGLDAVDVRGPGANTWTFTVKTNLASQPVTLTWTPTGNLPGGARVVLVDQQTGRRVDMRGAGEYTFRSGARAGDRTFRVEVR